MMTEGLDGRLIDGRFELLERLGGGGMGLVWRARDTLLHREIALKEVRAPDASAYGNDSSVAYMLRERVLREAQALARLHHPNVVTIYHIVDSHELPHPWLVMELVSGGSLHDRLNQGPLSLPEAVKIGRGVLGALSAAHEAGIQHRDVKPGNVLLRLDGTPVLTDFGIAALQESPGLTATGMLIGSPEYMAPERIRGQEGDPASDLWSLGLLLYVALEGFNPLRRETTIATIAAVVDAPIPAPTRSGPLAPVLGALLARDPAQRPSAEWLDRMFVEAERALAGPAASTTVAFAPPPHMENPAERVTEFSGHGHRDRSSGHKDRSKSKSRLVPYVTGIAVVGLSSGMAWTIHRAATAPLRSHPPTTSAFQQVVAGPGSTSLAASATPGTTDSPPAQPQQSTSAPAASGSTQNLLTPAGMRAMIAIVEKATGGTKIVELDVYPTYANIEAVKAADPTVYDNYTFRDGKASYDSPGSTLDAGQNTIDPTKVNWNALPALLKVADSQLKVPHPTDHYIILDSDLITQVPELLVYVSDAYGGGYLNANLDGTVNKLYPRGS